jgi:hypothetical protein
VHADRPEECAPSVTLYGEVLIGVLDLDLDRSTGLLARLGGVVLLKELCRATRSASFSDLSELGVASTDLSLFSLLLLTGVLDLDLDLDLDRDLSDLTTLGDRRLLPLVGASTSGAISLP